MRRASTIFVILATLSLGLLCWAQEEDMTVVRARAELVRISGLVTSGVLPRVRLEQAQEALADALVDATIRQTLYGKDITVDQANLMVEMTSRRVEHREEIVASREKLVSDGILAPAELTAAKESLDQAKKEQAWAEQRVKLVQELVDLAKAEQEAMRQMELATSSLKSSGLVEHFVGSNRFDLSQFPAIDSAFKKHFALSMPVSAMGESAVHKSLGFDHRNRVDIAVAPDGPQGQWLRKYLAAHNIPYFAFRGAVAGKATGAHIHIGPPSGHYIAQIPHSGRARGGE